MNKHSWTSQDGNISFHLLKVDGFKLWPAGYSGGSNYPRRLSVFVNGVEVYIDEQDIDSLLSILRSWMLNGGPSS